MQTFIFKFEELPLIIDLGYEAGLVNGSAEIEFWPDHSWGVRSISLDGHKTNRWTLKQHRDAEKEGRLLPCFDRKPVELDANTSLYLTILDRLEHHLRDSVQDEVNEQIADHRDSRADTIADHRYALRMEAV